VTDKLTVGAALAGAALVALILAVGGLMFIDIPTANRDLLNVALMALIGNVGTAFGYFLGTSESSKKKDDTIQKLAETL
jgi:hypothetical protein